MSSNMFIDSQRTHNYTEYSQNVVAYRFIGCFVCDMVLSLSVVVLLSVLQH